MKLQDLNQPAVWLFKIVAITGTLILMFSCTAYKPSVTHVTSEHRNIVGYEQGIVLKKRLYYTVTDSRGRPAIKLLHDPDSVLRPVGHIFLLNDEWRLQH